MLGHIVAHLGGDHQLVCAYIGLDVLMCLLSAVGKVGDNGDPGVCGLFAVGHASLGVVCPIEDQVHALSHQSIELGRLLG